MPTLSDTIHDLWRDLQGVADTDLISFTFAGITWRMQISSFKKIIEYANKYVESKTK